MTLDPVLIKRRKRNNHLLRKFGISIEQYEKIVQDQGGGCALCGKTEEQEGKALAVDHNHVTNLIRGCLCSYCNHRVIGRHRDPDLLRRMAKYIETDTGLYVPKRRCPVKRKPKRNG